MLGRWYGWKANLPVTADELVEWATFQPDVRNALERLLGRAPRMGLTAPALKRWLLNAVGMIVDTRLGGEAVAVELHLSHGPRFWLRRHYRV